MAIKVSQYKTLPQIAYDEIHVNEIRIMLSEDQNTKAHVKVIYKMMGRDAEGKKYFDHAQKALIIDDAFAVAVTKAQRGKQALAVALQAIEAAVASEIADLAELGTTSVV